MRRFTGTEKAALALAGVLIIGGLCMVVHPMDMLIFHPDKAPYVGTVDTSQHVSKNMARYIGGGTVLMGAVIAALIIFSPRNN